MARAVVGEAGRAVAPAGVALLVVAGDALLLADARRLGDETSRRWARVPLEDELARSLRTRRAEFGPALALLPLIASGRPLGILALTFPQPVALDEGERGLLRALAAQSAVALARAQAYEREHTVARTLQASLLPRALPVIPGLDLAARLEAGAPGLEVGGDFYDAFALADGVWGLAIGDVCGKGVDAAALTALARHTVRAAAQSLPAPSAVLQALNRAALAESSPGEFITAVFAFLRARGDGGFQLSLACGGHPPPVLLAPDLAPRELSCRGTLLGVIPEPAIVDAEAEVAPGDTLLLYTDGLTEAGAPVSTLTTEELAQLLADARGDTAAQTAEGCLERALRAGGGSSRDDIAVLVVQVPEPAPARARSTAGRKPARESSTPGQ